VHNYTSLLSLPSFMVGGMSEIQMIFLQKKKERKTQSPPRAAP
jgi:hypothetical protein